MTEGELGTPALRRYIAELEERRPRIESFIDSMKGDYAYMVLELERVEKGDSDLLGSDGWESFLVSFLFQPNRTRARLAAAVRKVLPLAEEGRFLALTDEEEPGSWSLRSLGNYAGEQLALMTWSSYKRMGETLLEERVYFRSTLLLVALRAYREEHGGLPETLNELVPDYLETSPLDPCDGKPLRYSREKKIVYSVGRDLVDSGGSRLEDDDEAREDEDEPTLRIGF